MKRSRRRRAARILPALIIILLIVILGGIFGAKLYFEKYSYSKETIDSAEYFGIYNADEVGIMHGDQMLDVRAKLIDGACYLDLDTVRSLLNGRFYVGKSTMDAPEQDLLLYALPEDLVRSVIGTKEWSTEAGGTVTESFAPAVRVDDTVYLSLDFVRNYANFSYTLYTDPNRIQLNTEWPEVETAEVLKDTQVRITGGIKSEILREISAGEKVTILERMEQWFPQPWKEGWQGTTLADRIYLEWGEKFDWPDLQAPEDTGELFCYGLRDQLGVLCDGTVVPCCLDHNGDIPLGNLYTQDLEEILNSPRATALYDGFSRKTPSEELCRRCGYARRFR